MSPDPYSGSGNETNKCDVMRYTAVSLIITVQLTIILGEMHGIVGRA